LLPIVFYRKRSPVLSVLKGCLRSRRPEPSCRSPAELALTGRRQL
jgi:hypothetical protein